MTSMTQIHLIGGEKGGVGKSMVSRLLAQYFIDHSLAFTGFDADRSHGALLRFYSGYASPVLVDQYESLDAIVEAATTQPDDQTAGLGMLERQRLQVWLQSAYDALATVNP